MPALSLFQRIWRWRSDTGSESSSAWLAAEGASINLALGSIARLRFDLSVTAGSASILAQLQYNANSTGWHDVNAGSSVIRSIGSGFVSDETPTTAQLSETGDTFNPGVVDTAEGLSLSVTLTAGANSADCEQEYCFILRATDSVVGDVIQFRIVDSNGHTIVYSTPPPQLTVTAAVPPPPDYCWTIGTGTSAIIDNPEVGDALLLKGFSWISGGTVISVKIDSLQIKCTAKGGPAMPASLLVALTKTGDRVAATPFKSIPLAADGVLHDLALPTALDFTGQISFTAADLTSGNIGIILDWSASFINCEILVDWASIALGQSPTAAGTGAYALAYGAFNPASGPIDEFAAAIQGKFLTIGAAYSLGASVNNWSPSLLGTTTLQNAEWNGWQYYGEFFFTNPVQGMWRRAIGAAYTVPFVPMYHNYVNPGSDGPSSATIINPITLQTSQTPAYNTFLPATGTTIAIDAQHGAFTSSVLLSLTTGKPTIKVSGGDWTNNNWVDFELDFPSPVNFAASSVTTAFQFTVAGVVTPPSANDTYTVSGVTYTITSVNLSGGVGIIIATGSQAPPASGTLARTAGAGDANISYSAFVSSSNTFLPHLVLKFVTSVSQDGAGTGVDTSNLGFSSLTGNNLVDFANATGFSGANHTGAQGALVMGPTSANQQQTQFFFFDLQGAQDSFPAVMAAVSKIRIRLGLRGGVGGGSSQYYRLDQFFCLGQYYHLNGTAFPNLETAMGFPASHDGDLVYAVNATEAAQTGLSSENATKIVIPAAQQLGAPLCPNINFGGSVVSISVPTYGTPFTNAAKLNIYRLVSGSYYLVAQSADNSATLNFTDTLRDKDILASPGTYPVTALNFNAVTAAGSGQVTNMVNGCEWKGVHVVCGNDGFLYFSQSNVPDVFLWPNLVITQPIPANAFPLTQIVSLTGALLVAIPQAVLFVFDRNNGWAIRTSSTPALSDFPTLLNGVRGVLGPKSACKYSAGVLFGSDDGLWYVEKSPYFTAQASDQPDVLEEVSKNNRPLWAKLIGDKSADVVIKAAGLEIWCFCQNRYFHINKNGAVVYGEWANGASVVDAAANVRRGMNVLFADGSLGITGFFTTDGATDLAGSNGVAPSWFWYGKMHTEPMKLLSIYLHYENPTGAPALTVTAISQLGTMGGDALQFTDPGGSAKTPFPQNIVQQVLQTGGDFWAIKLSGTAQDVVKRMELAATRTARKIKPQ